MAVNKIFQYPLISKDTIKIRETLANAVAAQRRYENPEDNYVDDNKRMYEELKRLRPCAVGVDPSDGKQYVYVVNHLYGEKNVPANNRSDMSLIRLRSYDPMECKTPSEETAVIMAIVDGHYSNPELTLARTKEPVVFTKSLFKVLDNVSKEGTVNVKLGSAYVGASLGMGAVDAIIGLAHHAPAYAVSALGIASGFAAVKAADAWLPIWAKNQYSLASITNYACYLSKEKELDLVAL